MSENEEQPKISAVPASVVIAYLSDLYRQLDAISFNIRQNISNIQPLIEGEAKDGNNQS